MASSNKYSSIIVTVFLVVFLFLVADAAAQDDYEAIIRANNCDHTSMEPTCAVEIVTTIFNSTASSSSAVTVTNRCCNELKVLGQVCHEALLKRLLNSPDHRLDDPAATLARAGMVWDQCQALLADLHQARPAAPPPAPNSYNMILKN